MNEREQSVLESKTLLGIAIRIIAEVRADKMNKLLDYKKIKELVEIENSVIDFRRKLQ